MDKILLITLYGFVVGVGGTVLGGFLSLIVKKDNKKILSFLLGLTGGLMLFIVTFHLLPEAFVLGETLTIVSGIFVGIVVVLLAESLLVKNHDSFYMKTSILIGICIASHNLPEGLALGSSFMASPYLGPVLALALLLHNIPEGMAMAIPLRINKAGPLKIIFITALAGVPTGIGAFAGAYLGNLSNDFIAFFLAFAGGTMLYIICDDLIPTGKKIYEGKLLGISVVIGFVLGLLLVF